jgi:hypothetical protein
MFHRFSAKPAEARSQTKGRAGAAAARASYKRKNSYKNNHRNTGTSDSDGGPSPEDTVLPPAKQQKTARACDRCRLHRIKCDEQKPCAQCVAIQERCIVSYAPPSSTQGISVGSSTTSDTTHNVHLESSILASHVKGFFASGQPAFSYTAAAGCVFPQLPHPAVPLGERPLASNALLKSQRSHYLRLFWDICSPLLHIMSETEFAELDAMPPPTMFDTPSVRTALVDSMIALGMQNSHATGLAGRILGLQQPSRQLPFVEPAPPTIWPGFEYFHRSRECMRTNTEITLEAIRCHALMIVFLIKGNNFRDAYNLLGIAIRKAYIANLHRLPPNHLPEIAKTARMQLWWVLFYLDLQCSLQLDMPTASQKSLVKCPFPAEDALACYVSSSNHCKDGFNACTYSTRLVSLAVIVTDIGACVSTADLVDNDGDNGLAALENHALSLSAALKSLEVWRDELPSQLLMSRSWNSSSNTQMLDFDRDLALPTWLQRQMVLLELHYHNAYTLIQRPFIHLQHAHYNDASGTITPPDSPQPHVNLQIDSALHHAIIIVETAFTVCSTSDILYGWPEVL